jgi:heme/copper-type cytochrome/quinol oxidase subunit 2
VLVTIMFLGSLALWLGVPVGWLWLGSQIQGQTDSMGLALGTMMIGMIFTVALLVMLLVWLNRLHIELSAARGRPARGSTALDQVLVVSAVVAVVGFGIWFFGFSGSEPIPLKISY